MTTVEISGEITVKQTVTGDVSFFDPGVDWMTVLTREQAEKLSKWLLEYLEETE